MSGRHVTCPTHKHGRTPAPGTVPTSDRLPRPPLATAIATQPGSWPGLFMKHETCQRSCGLRGYFPGREKQGWARSDQRVLPWMAKHRLSARGRIAIAQKVFPAAPRGATHALHGWARQGQPRNMSEHSSRNGFTAARKIPSQSAAPERDRVIIHE